MALPCHKEGEKNIKRKKYAHIIVIKISYAVIRKGRPQYQKWLRKICWQHIAPHHSSHQLGHGQQP